MIYTKRDSMLDNKNIYWFSGINKDSIESYKGYIEMYRKAVLSQRKTNPNIIPYLILDGDKDEYTNNLEQNLGVIIIQHRVSFYNEAKKHHGDNHIFGGAYIRVDIPIIVKDILKLDVEYVLYTDNDVMFMDDVTELLELKPKYFNISSEFSKEYKDINSGVMWININKMYECYNEFRQFIIKNFHRFLTYDQDAIKIFFFNKSERLDYKYNYKQYYGKSNDIKIYHQHGPKFCHLEQIKKKEFSLMYLVNDFYFEMVEQYEKLN